MAITQPRRLLGSIAPVQRQPNVYTQTQARATPSLPGRRSITELFNQPRTVSATTPQISYVPGTDVQRVPGFYNPQNPYDTGRAGEKNPEMAAAAGLSIYEDLPGWNYDLGRPMNANAALNAQGYYDTGSAGGGGAGRLGAAESDPILQKIRALSTQSLSNARAQAAALRKQAAIETGDENIAKEIGLDEATITAAKSNPFSRRASFLHDAGLAERELEAGLNEDNLFYSGHRASELSELGRRRAEGETTIGNDLRSQLSLIDQNLAEAEYQAQLAELEAQRQAMLDALMYGGYDSGGGYSDSYEEPYTGSYFVPLPGSGMEGSVPREYDDASAALASLLGQPRRVAPITMSQKLALLR